MIKLAGACFGLLVAWPLLRMLWGIATGHFARVSEVLDSCAAALLR